MVLEDFFTLTEMKEGLTALARVEELVAVMQTSDCTVKNSGDTARQWLTVATVLAATGNEHCLSRFIQSDGLQFLNQWLQVTKKCNEDTSDSFVEESISALLGALEKLPINSERLTTSGIRETIKHLLTHKNFKVQDKARSLFDSWNQVEDKDSICQDVSKGGACCDGDDNNDDLKSSDDMKISVENGCSKSPVCDESPIKETAEGTVSNHSEATKSSDDSQMENIKDVKPPTTYQDTSQADVNGCQGDKNSLSCSLMPNTCQESSTITKQCSVSPVEVTTSGGTCSSLIPGDRNIDDKPSDVSELKDRKNVDDRSPEANKGMEIEMNMKDSNPCTTYSKPDQLDALSPCAANDPSCLKEPDDSCDIDAKERESHTRKTASADLVDDGSMMEPNYSSTVEPRFVAQHGKSHANFLDLTSTRFISRKPEGLEELVREPDLNVSKGEDSVIVCLMPRIDDANGKSSEIEFDYGLDDALEVARRVAKEVEQEVVDYREPLCSSSSEKNVKGEMMQSCSPDSVEGEPDESTIKKPNEDKMPMEQDLCNGGLSSKEQDLCDGGSSPKAKRLGISNDSDAEPERRGNNLRSPKATAVTQETDNGNDKSIYTFDLNEDVCTDETECSATVNQSISMSVVNQSISVSAPIPVVAAFKGAPVSRTIPLHFEGELGWRGSAATSAFHPPSPRRTPDREKAFWIDEGSNGSKQRQNVFEIDLNVADGDDDAILDLASSAKLALVSSGLHPAVDSVEVSLRRAKRLKLDLNCDGDIEEDACAFSSSDWKAKGQLYNHQNGKPVPSLASSSSTRQTPMRDFDLNDNPSFFDTRGSDDHLFNNGKAPYQTKVYGSCMLDEPVASIMSSKIDLDRKEFANQTHSFLINGQGIDEPTNTASLVGASDGTGQPLVSFVPPPYATIGYNGRTMGSAIPFHPQLYAAPGSVPFMVDSSGSSSVALPFPGSSSAAPASFTRPFFINIMDAPSGSNGASSSQTGHDSNSGVTSVAADGTGTGTFSQLFNNGHGPGSLMEEQMKSATTCAGMSLKRKEPEGAWELNMVSYKGEEALWR